MNVRETVRRVADMTRSLVTGGCAAVLAAAMLLSTPGAASAEDCNPAIWKLEIKDNYAALLEDVKAGLEAQQFSIISEDDLAGALATNREILGMDAWNTIGFQEARAVHFCSLLFNQEVLNLDMDYSILCPFKVVLYSMQDDPEKVTIIMVRPSYLLAYFDDPNARAVGKKIEERIMAAIMEAIPH